MKYIFRGVIVFEYKPEAKFDKVIEGQINGLHTFNYCGMIDEDYKLLAQFFDIVYRHTQGEMVELNDIVVN